MTNGAERPVRTVETPPFLLFSVVASTVESVSRPGSLTYGDISLFAD